jgi:OOP family OmpA-OmpF porin
MHKKSLLIFLFILIVSLPVISHAEIQEGSFEINPFAGYCTTANSPVFCHKDIYGLRLGYTITNKWEIEGAYDYVTSSADMFHVDVLYHILSEGPFNPFVVAGFGGAYVKPKNRDSYDTVMADFGVGLKYFLSRQVAVRADIRDVITHSNNVFVTAGLTFAFGGKAPKVISAPPPAPQPEPKPELTPPPPPAPKPEIRPEPKPEPVAPAPTPEPVRIILEDIHFDFDKATLTPVAKEILKKNVEVIKAHPEIGLEIQGHTSAIGSEEYNRKLSVKRANAVKEYLLKEGIAAEKLTAVGYGKMRLEVPEPRPKNKESQAAKTNRRVHFEVIVK